MAGKNSKDEGGDAQQVRSDFLWVYKRLGGRKALLEWAGDNAKEFFKMFFSVLPRSESAGLDGAEIIKALKELAGDEDG